MQNPKRNTVACTVDLSLSQNDMPFLKIKLVCFFDIKEEEWEALLSEDKKKVKIPKEIADHFATVTIGAARGVMHAKTENTPFNAFLIPLLDISQTVKEDIVIGFSKKAE